MPPFLQNRRKIIIASIVLVAILALLFTILAIKNSPQNQPVQTEKISSDLQKGIYKCPVSRQFCNSGKDILRDKTYAGFGIDLATGSAVLASFDGSITGLTITLPPQFKSEKLNIIYLDNKENNIRATYYFKGEPLNYNQLPVKEGAILGKIEAKMQYFNTFLLFSITKGEIEKGEKIKLTTDNFI